MKQFIYPHTIENKSGEKLTFKQIISEPDGDRVLVEGICKPGAGPTMHVHFKQDESLTLVKGKMSYQELGKEEKQMKIGESITFPRGTPHRFWNSGDTDMHIEGWVKPANSIVFFLSSLYEAQNKSGNGEPEQFEGAYLVHKYKAEYDVPEIPNFVKKVIIPITYFIGKLTGKYKKFDGAPEPLK